MKPTQKTKPGKRKKSTGLVKTKNKRIKVGDESDSELKTINLRSGKKTNTISQTFKNNKINKAKGGKSSKLKKEVQKITKNEPASEPVGTFDKLKIDKNEPNDEDSLEDKKTPHSNPVNSSAEETLEDPNLLDIPGK